VLYRRDGVADDFTDLHGAHPSNPQAVK
jgi:hypothetical protein